MQRIAAIIISEDDLKQALLSAGKVAAKTIMEELGNSTTTPAEKNVKMLRAYISERNTIVNPREHWANSRDIRRIISGKNGNPRSYSWFQDFKKESRLGACFSRKSPIHGKLEEWCFEDIANAWVMWETRP